MALLGPILGLAGSIFGASKASKDRARSDYLNSPAGIRAEAEKAGFNPLVFAGPGTGTGAQYAPQVGNIIANGFATAADQLQVASQQKIELAELQVEKDRLAHLVEQSTLRPYVPGRFGSAKRNSETVPSGSTGNLLGRNGNPEPGDVSVTNAGDVGANTYVNPRVLDAETSETRYAEIGSEIAGIRNIFKDNHYNDRLQRVARNYGRTVADEVNRQYGADLKSDLDHIIDRVTEGKPLRTSPPKRPSGPRIEPYRPRTRVFNPLYSQY